MAREDMEVSFQRLMGKTDTSYSFPLLAFFFLQEKIPARAFGVVAMFTCQSAKWSFHSALAQNVSFSPTYMAQNLKIFMLVAVPITTRPITAMCFPGSWSLVKPVGNTLPVYLVVLPQIGVFSPGSVFSSRWWLNIRFYLQSYKQIWMV